MKYPTLLLIALAAMVPSSMALRSSTIDEIEFVGEENQRELGKSKGSKGSSEKMMKGSKGKGKGKGKGKYYPSEHPSAAPTACEEKNPLVLYAKDLTANDILQIDPHCDKEDICVGSFIPFKNHLYFDKHLTHKAGKSFGHCTVVGFHDHIPQGYCLFSAIWDYYEECTGEQVYAEIAAAGVTTTVGDSSYLGTATAGILKDLKYPTIAETVLDDGIVKFEILGEFPEMEEM